ncbi:phosphotransferase [Microbacterium sp. JZ31]|uniref:phosphotransferase n=1 Tax=Microbacterium sp. JZ31 TaxID=1906274 RepID=UPI00193189EE|nr:phosphotransferase [Microbacterium sp. JZ31]
MQEETLSGGNVTPVVRIGDTVRRETGPWTPAVHRLLELCARAGVAGTPRPLGIDDRGREILSYLPGGVLAEAHPDVLWSPGVLDAAARLLRRIHDASVPLAREATAEDPQPWRAAVHEPVEVICHNDFAPYNLLVSGDALAGAIDFDFASPGPRIWDAAYLAYRIAPLAEDADAFDVGRYGSPDQRIADLVAAYGATWSVAQVRATAAERLDELATFTEKRSAATGRGELAAHARMYRRDAVRLRA